MASCFRSYGVIRLRHFVPSGGVVHVRYTYLMNFKVTYHAEIRLRERNITLDSVKSIISNPKTKKEQFDQVVVSGIAKGHSLHVVYKYEKRTYVITIAYYED